METNKEYLRERQMPAFISESTGEYTLPDYNTDVKRMLCVSAKAIPSSKFMDGETLECVGVVVYEIVYLDSENNLTHCEFTTDYELKIKCNSESYRDAMVLTRVKNYNVRPIGPRRFSAKCVLDSSIFITENACIGVEGDTFATGEPETCTTMAEAQTAYYSLGKECEYAETLMSLEGVISDDIEVLSLNSAVRLHSVGITEGGVEYQGELDITALVIIGEELPTHKNVLIPISGMLPIEDVEEGMAPQVKIWVTSLTCATNPTDVGVDVTVSALTEACASVRGNESLRLITDCFLRDNGVENSYTDAAFCAHIGSFCEQIELDMSFERADVGAQDLRNIIHTFANCSYNDAIINGAEIKIDGILRLSVMACEINNDGMPDFVGLKLEAPFDAKVKNSCQKTATNAICDIQVLSCELSLDANKVYLRATLSCSIILSDRVIYHIVTASNRAEEAFDSLGSDIVIYYPEEGESLFDVARRFHTSLVKLASDNSLGEAAFRGPSSPSSLAGVHKLIIK